MKCYRKASEFGLFKAFALALIAATAARAGLAYLPMTGPAPMRVQVVKAPKALPEVAFTPLAAHDTNSPAAVENCVTDTNPVVVTSEGSTAPGQMPMIPMSVGGPMDRAFGTPIMALTSPDLMGITPQMLATYFQPTVTSTNNAVVVPMHVGFVPPMVVPPKSSHSEYIVK